MTTTANKTGPSQKTVTLQTELGIKLKVLQSHKDAEHVAHLKEAFEVAKGNYDRRLEPLLTQMQRDGIKTVKAKTAAGFTYKFSLLSAGEKLKVRRIVESTAKKNKRKH